MTTPRVSPICRVLPVALTLTLVVLAAACSGGTGPAPAGTSTEDASPRAAQKAGVLVILTEGAYRRFSTTWTGAVA